MPLLGVLLCGHAPDVLGGCHLEVNMHTLPLLNIPGQVATVTILTECRVLHLQPAITILPQNLSEKWLLFGHSLLK